MKNKQQKKQQHQPPKKNQPVKEKAGSTFNYGFLFAVMVVVFIIYLPALNNAFLWDDDDYIKNNLMIRSINLKEIFSTNLMGNYHPLTVLGYAIQYKFFGLSESGYHMVNILLHMVNTLLVFFVVFRLSGKSIAALVSALLFAVHPMHVESVAWASELKDLMYTCFFLLSYIYYMKFMSEGKQKFYVFSIFLFLLSLLSKAMAASLPVLLLLTDYFKGYKFTSKTIIQKVPYFILAVIFGLVAVQAQKSSGAVDTASFAFSQRILFASYGFITYLIKLALPLKLCAYYGYPVTSGGSAPAYYFIYLLLIAALAGAAVYSLRKTKLFFFSLGFFAITVFLVLQLLPVGWAIMADRYSYIPSIGIFYLAGEGIAWLWNRKDKILLRNLAVGVLAVACIFYSYKTYARCFVWKDSFTLWNDVIDQYQTIPQAYINRGIVYMNRNQTQEALNDFNKAIGLEPEFAKGYSNRAIIYTNANNFDLAMKDYEKAMKYDPSNAIVFHNRGILYKKNSMFNEALEDFNKAIKLKPTYIDAYINRGITLYNLRRLDDAGSDFNHALKLQPNTPKAIFYRGLSAYESGRKEEACRDLQSASGMGYQQAAEQYNKLCK